MTEYELGYLYNEYQNSLQTVFMNEFSILSAFLVASYLVAHRLSRMMVALLVSMFTFVMFSEAMRMIGLARAILGLRATIQERFNSGGGMSWHPSTGITVAPQWFAESQPFIYLVVCLLVFAAAIQFFFHCRCVNRTLEVPAPQAVTGT